jgi:hypothetical protein
VFLHRRNNEVHVMKKTRYDSLLAKLKKKQWYDNVFMLHYTKGGNDFNDDVSSCACSLAVSSSYMSLSWGGNLLKRLAEQDVHVKIFL